LVEARPIGKNRPHRDFVSQREGKGKRRFFAYEFGQKKKRLNFRGVVTGKSGRETGYCRLRRNSIKGKKEKERGENMRIDEVRHGEKA